MGVDRVTVKNLEIMEINEEANEMLLKGAIPGARGGIIMISTYEGGMEVTSTVSEESKEKSVEDSPKEVVTQTKEEEPKVAEEKNEVITDSVVSEDAKTTEEK